MRLKTSLLAVAVSLAFANAAAAQTAGPQSTQALTDDIAHMDRQLFDAVFESCDVAKLATLVADDFEFYHDKHGLSASSGSQWVDAIRGMCDRQRAGTDYRARRELIDSTLQVYPMNNYGALQIGVHRFYKKTPGKPDELVEVSRFTNLWKREGAHWKLTRVLSYDHRLTK